MANATPRYQESKRKKEENSFPVTCPRGVAPVTSPHRQLFQQTLSMIFNHASARV
jgi:hypothetical protein